MRWAPVIPALFLTIAGAEMPALEDVSARVADAKARENAALRNYTVLRHYVLTTDRAGDVAEMMVRLSFTSGGGKRFEVLWERGGNTIRGRVFRKLLEAEEEASRQDLGLTPDNYTLRLEGSNVIDGRRCYVVRLLPKTHNRFLLRGRAWVDAQDFSVVQVEGTPAASSSFWIRSTHVVQHYGKVDGFWLPTLVTSTADVRIFGTARLSIRSEDYSINPDGGNQARALVRRPPLE